MTNEQKTEKKTFLNFVNWDAQEIFTLESEKREWKMNFVLWKSWWYAFLLCKGNKKEKQLRFVFVHLYMYILIHVNKFRNSDIIWKYFYKNNNNNNNTFISPNYLHIGKIYIEEK